MTVQLSERQTQVERRANAEGALLDAAAILFATKGVRRTSLAEIGERAGYSRGLVSHHFGSKDALIERLARRDQDQFIALVEQVSADTGREKLLAILEEYFRAYESPTPESRSFQVLWGEALADSGATSFREADERSRRLVAALVRAGHEDGSISKNVSPESFGVLLLGLLRGTAAQLITAPGAVDLPELTLQCRNTIEAICRS